MRAILILAGFLSMLAPRAENAAADLASGHELVLHRAFAEARASYSNALGSEAAQIRSMARLAIAQSYVVEGDRRRAIDEFERLAADAPEHHRWEAARRAAELKRELGGLPARDPVATRTAVPRVSTPALVLNVDPKAITGADGSSERPFATLEAARDRLRALRRAGAAPAGPVEVRVHGGEYSVTETFRLGAEDSGRSNAPVVFRAADGERPVFRGGVRMNEIAALADSATLERLPAEARGKVLEADVRAAGLTNILPLKLGGFASGHGFKTHPAHELFFNGKALQLARGPNEGFLRVGEVVVKDGTKGYDRTGSKVGRVIAREELPEKWATEAELMFYGYWFWDWADSYERVTRIEADRRTVTLAEPYHTYGYSVGAPFYAINALCELDRPGEWYLDRARAKVYFWPPGEMAGATVELSTFAGRMVELHGAKHVRFEGITWDLGSADAIQVRGGANVLFAGCTVRRFAGNGVEIAGGWEHGLLSCDVYSMGRGGLTVTGGDRKTLTAGGHWVENCVVRELSRIDHTYTPAVILDGVGNRVAHNEFHEIASSALRVGGNDHVVEFNDVHDVVQESDDQGGVDMFGNATYRGNIFRFNSWRRIGKWQGGADLPKCGQAGVRLDDAISGTLVYGNIFERCSTGREGFGGVQIHGGSENIIDNNLFVACAAAVSFTPWNANRWNEFVQRALDAPEVDRALYLKRYPALAALKENPNRNYAWRNRTVLSDQFARRAPKNAELFDNLPMDRCNPVEEIPGFLRIPHEEIGLYGDEFRRK